MAKLEIVVSTNLAEESVTIELRFPDETMSFKGTLENLRLMVEGGTLEKHLSKMIGKDGVQDLRVDLRRILLNVEKEFGEADDV